jgi:hypothetical protein
MKTILIIFYTITGLLISCNQPRKVDPYRSYGRNLTIAEKNFIPYQPNDTCSFSDGKGGLLSFTCISRSDVWKDRTLNGCGPKDDICNIINEEKLEVNLACSNTIYNAKIGIYQSGNFFRINFYNQPYTSQGSQGYTFDGALYADSSCPLSYWCPLCPRSAYCLDSLVANNKKYYKVGKLRESTSNNPAIDTIYYNASNGLLRFCMSDSTIWTKR